MSVREAAAWVSVAFAVPTPCMKDLWVGANGRRPGCLVEVHLREALNHPPLANPREVYAGLAYSVCTIFSYDADADAP
jgi:hypothetical protein